MEQNLNDPNRKRTSGMANEDYRKERRKRNKPFNFEVDIDRREQLRQIAIHRGISMGATLRQLISTAFMMDIKHQPHCVSGRACFMPHLMPQQAPQDTLGKTHP